MSKSSYSCVRYLFCWLNVALWISGCGILGVGIWLKVACEGLANLLPQFALLGADTLAIAVGVITFVLAFFACCGSWCQNRCMLITYFSLVVCMFLAEFLVGSLAFIYREKIGHVLKEELRNGIQHHYNINDTQPNSLGSIWDKIQTDLKCCGVENYEDWFMIKAWEDKRWVPESCCYPDILYDKPNGTYCGRKLNSADNWYDRGCYSEIHNWFIARLYVIGVVGLGIAFIQLFGLISSMLLFCTVKHKRHYYTYKSYDMS
ncbi:tetraspanin-9 [Onthophagus taurus]|uniref:tetraspanin-9 n=1 Tax=Onthophagus taurus TaxID=166361 RepID=UPI000C200D77|nr:tetraspanin-9 [Onthophagus taurus]